MSLSTDLHTHNFIHPHIVTGSSQQMTKGVPFQILINEYQLSALFFAPITAFKIKFFQIHELTNLFETGINGIFWIVYWKKSINSLFWFSAVLRYSFILKQNHIRKYGIWCKWKDKYIFLKITVYRTFFFIYTWFQPVFQTLILGKLWLNLAYDLLHNAKKIANSRHILTKSQIQPTSL